MMFIVVRRGERLSRSGQTGVNVHPIVELIKLHNTDPFLIERSYLIPYFWRRGVLLNIIIYIGII